MNFKRAAAATPGSLTSSWGGVLLLLIGLMAGGVACAQPEISVNDVKTALNNGVIQLDARIHFPLSEKAEEALHKGVPITISLDIDVRRERRYIPDEKIAGLEQRYQIRFHALADQYVVTNLNSGIQNNFPSLGSALVVLGTVEGLPLIDKHLIESEGVFYASLRARLELESLPAPLRILAYFTPGWRQTSDWYSWNLEK